jgi:UDP-glucuronate 4-epimerase
VIIQHACEKVSRGVQVSPIATSLVGFHTCQALKHKGHSVVGLDNFNDYYNVSLKRDRAAILSTAQISVVEGDVCDSAMLLRLLREHQIDRVLHLAAQAGVRYSIKNPLAYVEANVRCFTVLLETIRQFNRNIPVVFASSSSVYGLNTKVPFSETDVVARPASLYAATKASDELIAHVYFNLYQMRVPPAHRCVLFVCVLFLFFKKTVSTVVVVVRATRRR